MKYDDQGGQRKPGRPGRPKKSQANPIGRPRKKPDPEPEYPLLPADVAELDEGELRELLLAEIEDLHSVAKAARRLKLSRRQVTAWLQDEAFAAEVESCKAWATDLAEGDLKELAANGNKANFMALVAFLNANHLSYGRIRAEMLERVLIPYIERVMTIVAGMVTTDVAERLRIALFAEAAATQLGQNSKRPGRG
ncbi:MAG: hypothetical protein ACYCW6_00290 [Candidatus Xenobia bacterium]